MVEEFTLSHKPAKLFDNIDFWSGIMPEKIFLRKISASEENYISYKTAKQKIIQLSNSLSAALKTTNIGLILHSDIETILFFYSILHAGKNVIIIDPCWGSSTIETVLNTADINEVISSQAVQNYLIKARLVNIESEETIYEKTSDHSAYEGKIIVFTSGTTSDPKGVVLSQAGLLYAYQLGIKCLDIDNHASSGCFYRISGLGILGINFLFMHTIGGTGNILPEFGYFNEKELRKYVEKYKINFLYLVPPIVNYLIHNYSDLAHSWLSCVLGVSSAAKLDREKQMEYQARFGQLVNIYGLTECGFAFLFGEKKEGDYTNSVGKARGLQLKILDESSNEITSAYKQGRLYVKTKSVFDGYYKNKEKTQEILKDGWLDTKDIAYFDPNNAVYLVGRSDDTINKGGNLFHLSEAEEIFQKIPGVIDACGLKVKCPFYDEDYIICLYSKSVVSKDDIAIFSEKNLGKARVPKKVICFDGELPRNGAGKYDRKQLEKMIEG